MDEEPLLVFPAQRVAGMRLSCLSRLALILAAVGLAIGVTSDYARAQVDRDAQKAVVVPAFKYTHPDQIVDAYSHVAYRPWTLPARTQYGYATSEFNPSKSTLLSVGFRPPQYVKLLFGLDSQWFNPQLTLGLSVSLSHGPTLPSGFVRTFAANHGSDLTTVFSGQVTWPRWDIKDDETKFVARIPFQKPFPFDASKGRSLVLDVRTSSSTGTGYPDEWIYEAVGTPDGGILAKPNVPLWFSCHPGLVMRITYPGLNPGGSWRTGWSLPVPPFANRQAVVSIGWTGVGSKWGNLTLPIGLLGSGCVWGVASEVFWPFNLDQNGGGMIPPLPIPNTQSVVGLRFFDQCAVFVPGFNALGLVSLPSYGWGIGSGLTPAAATLSLIHETGQPDGGLYPGGAGRVAFSYQ